MGDKPIALDAYEALADRYNALIDTKPHNAYYERPATLALLPEVRGLRVLDAGCGPGWYVQWLAEQGAAAVGIDASPRMIELAHQRLAGRADLRVADMGHPLDFLSNASFDLVISSLAVHYVRDLRSLFSEFARILRPGGWFVFSTEHPFFTYLYFELDEYFPVQEVGADWHGFGGEPVYVPTYTHPLSGITEALAGAGFVIERLVEPLPTEEFRQADLQRYTVLMRFPAFLCIRARKGSSGAGESVG